MKQGWQKPIAIVAGVVALTSAALFAKYAERTDVSFPAGKSDKEWLNACPPAGLLESGDLVFRHSRGTISNMLLLFSQMDPKYSHVGIVSIEQGETVVYHALGGEVSENQALRRESLASFCMPSRVHSFGIYRTELEGKQKQRALELAKQAWRHRIPFDTRYDLFSDSAYYCTEFVYKVLVRASGNKNYITLSKLPGLTYVSCDNLYKNGHTALIYSRTYSD